MEFDENVLLAAGGNQNKRKIVSLKGNETKKKNPTAASFKKIFSDLNCFL